MSAKIPTPPEPEITQRRPKRSLHATRPENRTPGPGDAGRGGRTITVRVEKERIDKMKAVIDHIGPKIGQRTLAEFVRTAIDKHIEELQDEHNKGKPFPQLP